MKAQIQNFKILIVGAGPAGTSTAIRLANKGFQVTLVEREKFPRHKLCGEFISPECLRHFSELGVLSEMISAGGDRITDTIFYEPGGKSVNVPSEWFNHNESALGLSRAEMDFRLLEKAGEVGVEILEETSVTGMLFEDAKVCGVKARKADGETFEISADMTIDATGRARVLGKLAEKHFLQNKVSSKSQNLKTQYQSRLVGFKAHLKDTEIERGRCEIYFFRGGYGGLSRVENEAANHCFLIKADIVKKYGGDAERIVREVIFQNKRAKEMMHKASPLFDWLAVSVDGFGAKNLNPASRLLAIGDAGAFIDPFTGSGMLMALESGELLARSITNNYLDSERIRRDYTSAHQQKFASRLRICKIMRRAAFTPHFAKVIISLLSLNVNAIKTLAKATRSRQTLLEK